MSNLEERIKKLAQWMFESKYLVIFIGEGAGIETPMDLICHLRFNEMIGEVFPQAVNKLKAMISSHLRKGE